MFNLNIDWQQIEKYLRSEYIIDLCTLYDPLEIAATPKIIIPAVCLLLALYFLKLRKTMAFLVGMYGMWLGFYYAIPPEGTPIDVKDVVMVGATFVGVAAYWIYMFLIRSD